MSRATDRLRPCASLVRRNDPDRYFCTLFAPPDRREALFALYALDHELAMAAARASAPLIGEIRQQWWREALDGIAAGAPRRHEVVEDLAVAVAAGRLAPARLAALVDAHGARLVGDSPATVEELEEAMLATEGAVARMALDVLGVDEAAAGQAADDAGVAWGLAVALRSVGRLARRGKVALPRDVLARHGLDPADVVRGRPQSRIARAVGEIAGRAGDRVRAARSAARMLPRRAVPALLPVAFAARDLASLRASGYNPFDPALGRQGGGRQLAVLWRALLGRI